MCLSFLLKFKHWHGSIWVRTFPLYGQFTFDWDQTSKESRQCLQFYLSVQRFSHHPMKSMVVYRPQLPIGYGEPIHNNNCINGVIKIRDIIFHFMCRHSLWFRLQWINNDRKVFFVLILNEAKILPREDI